MHLTNKLQLTFWVVNAVQFFSLQYVAIISVVTVVNYSLL